MFRMLIEDLSSGNVLKPSLDLLLFTSQLSRTLGVRGTLLLFVNYYITARILRAVTPAFGRLAAVDRGVRDERRVRLLDLLHCSLDQPHALLRTLGRLFLRRACSPAPR